MLLQPIQLTHSEDHIQAADEIHEAWIPENIHLVWHRSYPECGYEFCAVHGNVFPQVFICGQYVIYPSTLGIYKLDLKNGAIVDKVAIPHTSPVPFSKHCEFIHGSNVITIRAYNTIYGRTPNKILVACISITDFKIKWISVINATFEQSVHPIVLGNLLYIFRTTVRSWEIGDRENYRVYIVNLTDGTYASHILFSYYKEKYYHGHKYEDEYVALYAYKIDDGHIALFITRGIFIDAEPHIMGTRYFMICDRKLNIIYREKVSSFPHYIYVHNGSMYLMYASSSNLIKVVKITPTFPNSTVSKRIFLEARSWHVPISEDGSSSLGMAINKDKVLIYHSGIIYCYLDNGSMLWSRIILDPYTPSGPPPNVLDIIPYENGFLLCLFGMVFSGVIAIGLDGRLFWSLNCMLSHVPCIKYDKLVVAVHGGEVMLFEGLS
ncbi:MAG TPA: hypothetical protein ENG22_03085 [Candidatus Bathyarchaeota archaeon]|nr:hypothetical protein [Candidatus Bathyarchaeota archaeon]